ncbi:hypothetical protein [Thermococcus sp.]
MSNSRRILYETLGAYIDDLSNALYMGTARGKIAMSNGNGKYEITPLNGSMPLIDIFYKHGTLEFVAFWANNGENKACRLKVALSKTSMEYHSKQIILRIEPHGALKGMTEVILLGNKEFANTLKRTIYEEKHKEPNERCGILIASSP